MSSPKKISNNKQERNTIMRKICTALLGATLGLLLPMAVFADDNSADLFADTASGQAAGQGSADAQAPAGDSGTGGFALKLSGSHEMGYHAPAYWSDGNADYSGAIKAPAFRTDLGAEVQDGNVKLVSHWLLSVDPLATDTSDPNASWGKSLSATPLENYVSWRADKFKLSAGYQIFAWGVADRKNPTDNLNPRDYTVGVNPDKIPVLSYDLVWYPTERVSMEGVFVPYKATSQYPQDFAALIVAKSEGQLTSSKLGYSENSDPSDFTAGGKLNYHSPVVDLSLDYLYDLDQYYTPEISIVKPAPAIPYIMTAVSLDRKRIQRFGGDAKTTVGKFGLWLETAYSLTENDGASDYSTRRSKLEYTLGTDVNYGPNDSFYANIQYFGAWIPGFDSDFNAGAYKTAALYSDRNYARQFYERNMVNALGLETEGLLQGVTCNLKWELADGLITPQMTAVYALPFQYDDTDETRYGALVLNPEIDFKPVDSFHIVVGSDLYYAWHKVKGDDSVSLDTTGNAIGSYTPSNNVYLKVVYKWNADLKK